MSTFSKKKMLEIIDDLIGGNDALKNLQDEILSEVWLENIGFFNAFIGMIKEFLLTFENEYSNIIEIINNYSNNLQTLQSSSLNIQERKKVSKNIGNQLQKIRTELVRLFPNDKKELVFFPYTASMWDSLESVWQAAVNSGEFDVFVVPIPYFERNPDGSLGEMRYDGKEYPYYVQAIHWESYDIAERKPDIAYIHNPYDGDNLVTSVHPDYYSEVLKQYVETLVYIPYFVIPEKKNKKVPAIAEHFCVTPVTLRADKIIVKSEEEKKVYVSELYKFGKQYKINWSKQYLESKILPLGSPKQDKAIMKRDDLEDDIPLDWKRIITKPDGTRKKVIFYNTSLSTVLQYGEVAINKIKQSLEEFEQNKHTVALLWRPHPLMEATLKSMKPHLHSEYLNIVKKYKKDEWGIFDESGDFNRATEISDGYFGDPSSVVAIFSEMKKPIMRSNLELLK